VIFEFDNAIVRAPARSVIHGLSSRAGPPPTFEAVAREHGDYVRALEDCGLSVELLPPLEEYPDSVFVEDPALVLGDAAIVLRPGAQTRFGEAEHIKAALSRRFERVLSLEEGFADGGDMLLTDSGLIVGLSGRTNLTGANAVAALLQSIDISTRIVETPRGTLHLKSDCSLIDADRVLCTAALAASPVFENYRKLVVPAGEERAANSLRLNDTILVGDDCPRTIELLRRDGYSVRPLTTRAIGKLDAGLSCMSLRWNRRLPAT
jgi:dimethylargininase